MVTRGTYGISSILSSIFSKLREFIALAHDQVQFNPKKFIHENFGVSSRVEI